MKQTNLRAVTPAPGAIKQVDTHFEPLIPAYLGIHRARYQKSDLATIQHSQTLKSVATRVLTGNRSLTFFCSQTSALQGNASTPDERGAASPRGCSATPADLYRFDQKKHHRSLAIEMLARFWPANARGSLPVLPRIPCWRGLPRVFPRFWGPPSGAIRLCPGQQHQMRFVPQG
jgi:hypothetical protein